MSLQEFQSTLPLRGVTCEAWEFERFGFISIHTPLAGSDSQKRGDVGECLISIHTPLAGSDRWSDRFSAPPVYFNPHSPCGE